MDNPILRGYTNKAESESRPVIVNDKFPSSVILIASILLCGVLLLFAKPVRAEIIPNNLYMGIVCEDTSGDIQTYLAIASVVRNRLDKGMNIGLVALKRKNLEHFFQREYCYALTKGIDLITISQEAIKEVFNKGKDFSGNATHYEHTGKYPAPKWAKNMQITKVMYQGTKREITFYK